MSTAPQLDPFQQGAADSQRAILTFLPSLGPKPPAPAPIPPPQVSPQIKEGIRAASLVRHVEMVSKRVARGLPPTPPPPPSPQETFPPAIDQVHIRALQTAIAAHPEIQRPDLIHEAHANLTKWIAAHNGQIVHDGHVEIAGSPESAEKLAAKIINQAVDEHDTRVQSSQSSQPEGQGDGKSGKSGASKGAVSGPARGNPQPGADRRNVSGATPQDVSPVGQLDPASGRITTQSSPDLNEAQKRATAAAPELQDQLEGVADSVPGAEVDGIRESKDPERAQQKVDADGKPVETQTDLLAGRIAVDSPEAKEAAVQKIKDSAPVIDEEDNFQQGDPDYGFRSHTLQVASKDGSTSAEVQVVPKEIADADEQTHDTYEKGRDAEASGDDETAQAAMDANKAAHDDAMDKFNERNSDQPARIVKSLEGAGFKVRGKPVKIGGHFFVPVVDDGQNQ